MQNEIEISLLDFWGAIKKRLALIILLVIVFTGAAYGISKVLPKEYQTYTTMLLGLPEGYGRSSQDGISAADINLNKSLVGTYREYIKSRVVSEEVIDNLGLDMSYEDFRKKLDVTSLKETEMITIKVTDTIPLRAKDIANETADIFRVKVAQAFKIDNVQVVDYAVVPTSHIRPKILFNTLLGGVIGLLLGVFIALLVMILDTTIKTGQDVEEFVGLPVLGVIPIERLSNGRRK